MLFSNHLHGDDNIHGEELTYMPNYKGEISVNEILNRAFFNKLSINLKASKGKSIGPSVRPGAYPLTLEFQYETKDLQATEP